MGGRRRGACDAQASGKLRVYVQVEIDEVNLCRRLHRERKRRHSRQKNELGKGKPGDTSCELSHF
jgi:hypothetical protein